MNIEETSDFTKVINAKRFNGPDELAADYLKERNESKASYPKDELDAVKRKISKATLDELEKNYAKNTIKKVLEALIHFAIISEEPDIKVVDKQMQKAVPFFKKKANKIIQSADTLLGVAFSDIQKKAIQEIKAKAQKEINRLSQIKAVIVDPFKERELSILYVRRWEYPKNYIFKHPQGRPKNLIINALVIVIFRLLKKEGKQLQIKRLYKLTADIINQCYERRPNTLIDPLPDLIDIIINWYRIGIDKKLTPKDIENALHST